KTAPMAEAPNNPLMTKNKNKLRTLFGNEINLTGRIVKNNIPEHNPCITLPIRSENKPAENASISEPHKNKVMSVR
ncbi:hypothetical protein PFZ55_56180, partial [Streptomyces sp. MS2A]|nr:hypothetical protein [Streptomyces sp. MS2A]